MSELKGGSALHTIQTVAAPRVSAQIAHEWGEALWTSPHEADAEFQKRLRSATMTALVTGRIGA